MAKGRQPKWDPAAWLNDEKVRSVSYAARGLWMDMLCLMYQSDRTGFLQLHGTPIQHEQLAFLRGGSGDEVSRLLTELSSSGVFSYTDQGTIYCRRIVRAETKREKCRVAGIKGGGNPTFKGHPKGRPKGGSKGGPKGGAEVPKKQGGSEVEENGTGARAFLREEVPIPQSLECEEFLRAWMDWMAYRTKRRLTKTPMTIKSQLALLENLGPDLAVESITNSITNGWQGLFKPKPKKGNDHGGTKPSYRYRDTDQPGHP